MCLFGHMCQSICLAKVLKVKFLAFKGNAFFFKKRLLKTAYTCTYEIYLHSQPGCHNLMSQTEWLKKHLRLIFLAAGSVKIKVLVGSVPDGGPLAGLQTACLLAMSSYRGERMISGLSFSSYKNINSIMDTPILMTSSKPNYLPKVPPLNTIILEVRFQHMNLWEGHKYSFHHLSIYLNREKIPIEKNNFKVRIK